MEIAEAASDEIAQVAEGVMRGMVRVVSAGRGAGAGTVWHPEGLVLTNAHVAGRGPLTVYDWENRHYGAKVLAVDRNMDLAALSIEAEGFRSLELGRTEDMRAGDIVIAMGYPWGVEGGLTMGVFIGMQRWWPHPSRRDREWLMASLHLRPGHSGGPMVNADGQLIGINTIMRGPDVGVAIPVGSVKFFLKRTIGSYKKAA